MSENIQKGCPFDEPLPVSTEINTPDIDLNKMKEHFDALVADRPVVPYIQVSPSLRTLTGGRDIVRVDEDYFIVSQEWLDSLPKSDTPMINGIPVHKEPRPYKPEPIQFYSVDEEYPLPFKLDRIPFKVLSGEINRGKGGQ